VLYSDCRDELSQSVSKLTDIARSDQTRPGMTQLDPDETVGLLGSGHSTSAMRRRDRPKSARGTQEKSAKVVGA
jgi:hypothetical protein